MERAIKKVKIQFKPTGDERRKGYLIVTVPVEVVQELNLRAGNEVEVTLNKTERKFSYTYVR